MSKRMALSLGLSTLLMGGSIAGSSAIATASDRTGPAAEKAASQQGAKAANALAHHKIAQAIGFAEAAVGLSPRNANYRMLLGQSYMQAGRFASARTTFADVLALTPDDRSILGKAALNLALAQTAVGDWSAARRTLDAHATIIPVGDLGLAVALAGDPAGAVGILTAAARQPGANAKIRQNLALALALSGQWNVARVVAAADLSPADVDARIEQWASFAQPRSSADQVAALIGVKPIVDTGQPVALALNATVPVTPVAEPVAIAAVAPAPRVVAPVSPDAGASVPSVVPVAPASVAASPMLAKVVFGPAREIVQPTPVATIRAAAAPTKLAVAKAVASTKSVPVPARGDWVVQLGAFENAGVARNGWMRASQRYAALRGHQPTGTNFASKAGAVYRLSVGGFARADADQFCHGIRARGGACFVRKAAGDQTAQWLRKAAIQVAAR